MNRRNFLQSAVVSAAALRAQPGPEWGGPVLDSHLHLRREADACFTHMQGSGVTHAVLLTSANGQERAKAEMEKRPGVFRRSVEADPGKPDGLSLMEAALRGGAVSIGELKYRLALDSPEMQRVYGLAAELNVPVMMHIQVFPHFAGEPPYNTHFESFDKAIRANPKTNFIGHGDFFWANISAKVPADRGYPDGPIVPGGLMDKWLGEFPNLYADLSANSGNNALSRDPAFTRGFLMRHRSKLIFGSDCSCNDGKGGGISQGNNPEASRLAGKCVARATLEVLRQSASPEVFRKLVWENGNRLFRAAPGR